jgi:hypothetical protein
MYMSDTSSRLFKFKGFLPAFTVLVLFIALWILFAVVIPIEGGSLGGTIFCLSVAVLLLFLGLIFLIGKSDIIIDDDGISRALFGKTIQVVPWIDVQRVVVYPVRAAGVSRGVTAYNIVASPSSSKRSNGRKIYFNDQSTDLTALIDFLNIFIVKHQIRVEYVAGGHTTIKKSI